MNVWRFVFKLIIEFLYDRVPINEKYGILHHSSFNPFFAFQLLTKIVKRKYF